MNKTLLVALREFRHRVRKRGFLLSTVGTPLILLVVWFFTGGAGRPAAESLPEPDMADRPDQAIGYVDQAELIQSIPDQVPGDVLRAFPDVEAAGAALERGEIGAYYVVQPDYRETGAVRRVSLRLSPNPSDVGWFNGILVANLLPEADSQQVARLRRPFYGSGPEFARVSPEGQTEARGNDMLPFIVTIAIMIPLFTSGSYLFQSLAQEKSSRVIEILLASLRPRQLLTGKLLGLGGLTLVQYAGWAIITLLGATASGRDASQLLSGVRLSAGELLLVVPFALGGYLLYAALMAGIGALSRDVEDSRAWIFVISLPIMIPIYLWVAIARAPNGPLATALSLIPFSAPVAMLLRMTSTSVPAWQAGLSLILLGVTGVVAIRLMARLFRAQTLLSGEAPSFRRFLAAVRS